MLTHGKLLHAELLDDSTYPYTDVREVWERNKDKHAGRLIVVNAHWHDPGPAYIGNYKAGGRELSRQFAEPFLGYGWSGGELPEWAQYMAGVDNFLSTIPALRGGERLSLDYGSGVGRPAERTWFGRDGAGEWYVEVTTDNYTLTGIVERMEALGVVDGMVLDGSGSSQWYDGEAHITGDGRRVYSFLLLWFEEIPKEGDKVHLYQQMATKNKCYITGAGITPCGVMVHSTGANNPNLKRYVQPDDGRLGMNPYSNSFNEYQPGGRNVCPHAVIGKLADGSVASYQILPWDVEGWHAGGTANKLGYIGFEICEDALKDAEYFAAVYDEAVALTAYLCRLYGFDPQGETAQGYPTVLCHSEAAALGIASNHSDVTHWFPRFGKTMDDFRADVAARMEGNNMDEEMTWEEEQKAATEWVTANGISDGERPQDGVKRIEFWVTLWRMFGKEGKA